MTFKLLIDECLSPRLARLAQQAGHHESSSVRDRGWSGLKDWELIEKIVDQDFTLVTHNSKDFRGKKDGPPNGLHNSQPIHAGLVCLNVEAQDGMSLDLQEDLFKVALEAIKPLVDLVNTALEVTLLQDGATVQVDIYKIPAA